MTGQARPLPVAVCPPWLWLFGVLALATTGWNLPAMARDQVESGQVVWRYATGARWVDGTVLAILSACAAAPAVLVLAAAALTVLPGLRGWVVRRRLARDAMRSAGAGYGAGTRHGAEIRAFAARHAPGVRVDVVSSGQGGQARVYAAGWWRPRIVVYPVVVALWTSDRRAAEAVLLHEIGHIRSGDHVLTGFAGPFRLLARAWAPVYGVLLVVPLVLLPVADAATLRWANWLIGHALVGAPGALVAPVLALWVAELAADRFAAVAGGAGGADAMARALGPRRRRSPQELVRRAGDLLTHPPRWLRRAALRGTGGWIGLTVLLCAWPLAFVGELLLLLTGALATYALYGQGWAWSWHGYATAGQWLLATGARSCLVAAVLLAAWPLLAAGWTGLWSGARARNQPTRSASGTPASPVSPAPPASFAAVSAPSVSAPPVSAPPVSAPSVSAPSVSAPHASAPSVSVPPGRLAPVPRRAYLAAATVPLLAFAAAPVGWSADPGALWNIDYPVALGARLSAADLGAFSDPRSALGGMPAHPAGSGTAPAGPGTPSGPSAVASGMPAPGPAGDSGPAGGGGPAGRGPTGGGAVASAPGTVVFPLVLRVADVREFTTVTGSPGRRDHDRAALRHSRWSFTADGAAQCRLGPGGPVVLGTFSQLTPLSLIVSGYRTVLPLAGEELNGTVDLAAQPPTARLSWIRGAGTDRAGSVLYRAVLTLVRVPPEGDR